MPMSRMNALKIPTDPQRKTLTTNLGNLGATVTPLVPSNDPGPMTSPSAQGPVFPGPYRPSGDEE